jgi:hypothetical protein
MSAVSEIVTLLLDETEDLLPTYSQIPHLYSVEDNTSQMDKVFGVRVGSASVTSGVNRSITFNHSFIIDLIRKHVPKKDLGDKDLRDKIILLHDDIQTLYKSLSLRSLNFTGGKVLLISPLDISEPTNENGIVTVSLTLSIQYRVAI